MSLITDSRILVIMTLALTETFMAKETAKRKERKRGNLTSGTEQKEGKRKTGWGLVTPAAPEAEHPEARARVLGTPKKKAGTLLIG